MALAARAVTDRLGNIFVLREAQSPSEGDVEFAAGLDSAMPPIFIVDGASKHTQALRSCIQRLRDAKLPALFLFGSRLNQWHETTGRPSPTEYVIEPLSDDEIDRLLDCLLKANELGVLADLSRTFQFAAIKNKYQQELLVVLREATEGRLFDAIIEDEYRALSSDEARSAYLIVSCFYQAGIYIRDSLLADLLGISRSDMYTTISGPTEGVIIFDEIDAASGASGARARHRTIAAIVWARCGSAGERERLVSEALSLLNLNYRVDVDAFWAFVQSDSFVDGLRTLDDRIKFFEAACRKDPLSPYVRQHYARMFKRAGYLQLALKEIDQAIDLSAETRILYHTRGLILCDLALEIPSEDHARKRLIQAEDSFKKCISMDPRDDYGYSGLAQADLRWAKRVKSDEESNDYIAKADAAISDGLGRARAHEQLWLFPRKSKNFRTRTQANQCP